MRAPPFGIIGTDKSIIYNRIQGSSRSMMVPVNLIASPREMRGSLQPLPVRPLSAGAFDGAAFLILDAAAPMRYTDTAFDKGIHFRRALWRYSHR